MSGDDYSCRAKDKFDEEESDSDLDDLIQHGRHYIKHRNDEDGTRLRGEWKYNPYYTADSIDAATSQRFGPEMSAAKSIDVPVSDKDVIGNTGGTASRFQLDSTSCGEMASSDSEESVDNTVCGAGEVQPEMCHECHRPSKTKCLQCSRAMCEIHSSTRSFEGKIAKKSLCDVCDHLVDVTLLNATTWDQKPSWERAWSYATGMPGADVDGGEHDTKLRREAKPIQNLLTHLPYNKYCDACVLGKMTHAHHIKVPLHDKTKYKKFGDTVTCDHIDSQNWPSCGGHVFALQLKDLATKFVYSYPAKSKDGPECLDAFMHYMGRNNLKRVYADRASELQHVATKFRASFDSPPPDTPQANGVIDRFNRSLEEFSRAVVIAAGLPPFFWDYAVKYSATMQNVRADKELGKSLWMARHGVDFPGELVPFGAEVSFIAPTTGKDSKSKLRFSPKNRGVFLGHELASGCKFKNSYMVAPLEDFDHKSFIADAGGHWTVQVIRVDRVRMVPPIENSKLPVAFPLKCRYDRENRTTDGRVESALNGQPRGCSDLKN